MQPPTNPPGEITGTSFFVHIHLFFFFFLSAKKLATALLLCNVFFTPQRAKVLPRYRPCIVPAGVHEDTGHKHSSFVGLVSSALSKLGLPFPFCLCCCPGQNKNTSKEKMLLKLKLKVYREQQADSLTRDNGKLRSSAGISKPPLQEGRKNQLEQACHPWS